MTDTINRPKAFVVEYISVVYQSRSKSFYFHHKLLLVRAGEQIRPRIFLHRQQMSYFICTCIFFGLSVNPTRFLYSVDVGETPYNCREGGQFRRSSPDQPNTVAVVGGGSATNSVRLDALSLSLFFLRRFRSLSLPFLHPFLSLSCQTAFSPSLGRGR